MDRGSEPDYYGYSREVEDFPANTEDHVPHDGRANYKEAGQRSVAGHNIEHNRP